jgi:VWFA-related protein
MYDAIVFSMLQFEHEPGRKALVILTDGDDHESRYGPKYCAALAQDLGVPIYIIGLDGLDSYRRAYSKKDLHRVTDDTGGRLYFVGSIQELDAAYAQIQTELRSQYSLSFYADHDLTPKERREVGVRLRQPGLSARTVVGARKSQL